MNLKSLLIFTLLTLTSIAQAFESPDLIGKWRGEYKGAIVEMTIDENYATSEAAFDKASGELLNSGTGTCKYFKQADPTVFKGACISEEGENNKIEITFYDVNNISLHSEGGPLVNLERVTN